MINLENSSLSKVFFEPIFCEKSFFVFFFFLLRDEKNIVHEKNDTRHTFANQSCMK